jgi:hypothetical protein
MFSKVMELHILSEVNSFSFNDLQFGFVKRRGTTTDIALAHDVTSCCLQNGSQVYMCGLDAEAAFGGIPHPVLFQKALGVLSTLSWSLLYRWYSRITVQIKWKKTSRPINIEKGTKQGGLTSPFLFNLFYKDLVDKLSRHEGGITIANMKFNVFCYADDLLLASLTVSGLQSMINTANKYICDHGLRFNSLKTTCIVNGKAPFVTAPRWYINEYDLQIQDNLTYLGAILGNQSGSLHINNRISACRKSYFALQRAGLCKEGLDIQTAMFVFSVTCMSALTYACDAIYLNKGQRQELNSAQGKLVKSIVGIGAKFRTTPLLDALGMCKVTSAVDVANLNLLKNTLKHESGASKFYQYMLLHGDQYK